MVATAPIKLRAATLLPIPYAQTAIYKPTDEVIKKLAQDYAKAQSRSTATSYDPNCKIYFTQCVCWAKTLTGHYGTWGIGGNKLSLNSGPVVGAVIIFTYNHVGIVTATDGYNITYTDRNFIPGTVRQAVETTINDPTIKGYHLF